MTPEEIRLMTCYTSASTAELHRTRILREGVAQLAELVAAVKELASGRPTPMPRQFTASELARVCACGHLCGRHMSAPAHACVDCSCKAFEERT